MAKYAISMTDYIPAKKSRDGKPHQHKWWYSKPLDFGLGLCPVFGRRKERMIFDRKADANAVAKMLRPRHVVVEKIK